jgi:hypothetical protein
MLATKIMPATPPRTPPTIGPTRDLVAEISSDSGDVEVGEVVPEDVGFEIELEPLMEVFAWLAEQEASSAALSEGVIIDGPGLTAS